MRIFVGNLSRDISEDELREAFSPYGNVGEVSIVKDQYTKTSKGFAFVEMTEQTEAEAAMSNLNGKDLKGRPLTVNEARPRPERSSRGDSGGFRERRGGGGGGGGRGGRGDRREGGGRKSW